MYKHHALTLASTLMLSLLGCRNPLPCPDCNDEAAEADETPPPDLPCDGADLMTDNLNCGSCGHQCGVWFPDTPVEAGACVDGECGAVWSNCRSATASLTTCADVCTLYGSTCVANGCSGYTGILFWVGLEGNCGSDGSPDVVMSGGCDEAIPWMPPNSEGSALEVMCCCDFQ